MKPNRPKYERWLENKLKEQEDFDETMRANNIKNGQIPRRSRMQEDLLNLSLLNNSGFVGI